MNRKSIAAVVCCILALALFPDALPGQIDPDVYERAARIRTQFQSLALNMVDQSGWIENTARIRP